MGRYNHSLSLDATIMVSKNYPIIGEHVVIIFKNSFLKKSVGRVQSQFKFRKFKVALNPIYIIFFELCQKLRLIMLIKS